MLPLPVPSQYRKDEEVDSWYNVGYNDMVNGCWNKDIKVLEYHEGADAALDECFTDFLE